MNNQLPLSDEQILQKLDVSDTIDERLKTQLLNSVKDSFELKFGVTLSQLVNDEQADEFAQMQEDGKSDEELATWIEKALPDQAGLRAAVLDDVLDDLKDKLDQIMG